MKTRTRAGTTYYEFLKVSPDASSEEIQQHLEVIFKKTLKKVGSPPSIEAGCELTEADYKALLEVEEFVDELEEVYRTLCNPDKKMQYDEALAEEAAEAARLLDSESEEEEPVNDAIQPTQPTQRLDDENHQPTTNVQQQSAVARGFFHPFYTNNKASAEAEARKILNTVRMLLKQFSYQQVYFTCSTNHDMAKEIEKAQGNGERTIHAQRHLHPDNHEAVVMMEVERLLDTAEFKQLREFYIAPISISMHRGGKGVVPERVVRRQLGAIEQKLEQGHAVFCVTNKTRWKAGHPFSVAGERLSIDKDEKLTFPRELDDLTQQTLMEYKEAYPIPAVVRRALKENGNLQETAKDPVEFLKGALMDPHLLKTWPLRLDPLSTVVIGQKELFKAVTIKEKQALIYARLEDIATEKEKRELADLVGAFRLPRNKLPRNKNEVPTEPVKQLAHKYVDKLKTYLLHHEEQKLSLQDEDVTSKMNRVKLATNLIDSLNKIYTTNQASMQDFFSIADSAESYAVQLRGTRSTLLPILHDLAWEAGLLRQTNSNYLQQEAMPADDLVVIKQTQEAVVSNIQPKWIDRFQLADDREKVVLLQAHLATKMDKTYGPLNGEFWDNLRHSKWRTIDRIKEIKTNDLYAYWLILRAEFGGQGESSSSIKKALSGALDVLEAQLPAQSSSDLRDFTLFHAVQLLMYVNERERSISYKSGTAYALAETSKHINKAGELAHALAGVKTLQELHSVVLDASTYKNELLNQSTWWNQSALISILDKLEKAFERMFRNQCISKQEESLDEIWQNAFGGKYLDEKFKIKREGNKQIQPIIEPKDRLQKRCYDLAKEKPKLTASHGDQSLQYARMCALADMALISNYPNGVGRQVRKKIGADHLEKYRRECAAAYYAQYLLAMLDEVNTERHLFKQKIEQELAPFLTEKRDLADLHMTIKVLSDIIKGQENTVARFFVPSNLRTFLERFNGTLEKLYPEINNQAQVIKKLGLSNKQH